MKFLICNLTLPELPAYTIVSTVEPYENKSMHPKNIVSEQVIQALFDQEIKSSKNCKTNSSQFMVQTNKPSQDLTSCKSNYIQIVNDKLTEAQIKEAERLINNDFYDIFASNNKPSKTSKVSYSIETGDAKPTHGPPYRASKTERENIQTQV